MSRTSARIRILSMAFGALLSLGASCEKTPPEPAEKVATPTPSQSAAPAAAALPALSAASTRPQPACVRKTPASPPPMPRYRLDPACPKDPAGGPPMVPVGHVAFPESKDAPRLEVELMLTDAHRGRGLMYRQKLEDGKGMLFVWSKPAIQGFWMHNTCIPLDLLFIDGQGFVAGIVENAPTLNDESRSIDCPVPYVLEVPAGWSRKYGVVAGQRVDIEGVPPSAP
jgi:uncharacterized protein